MKKIQLLVVAACMVAAIGCQKQEVAKGPIKGTVNLDGLTPDQQIAKIKADNSIPERYKDLYINSVRSKQGLPPQNGTPGAPGGQ